jgi:hypothetical protein
MVLGSSGATIMRQKTIFSLLSLALACSPTPQSNVPDLPPAPDAGATLPNDCNIDDLGQLYEHYIEPFVSGTQRSSCSQCHMTGVDISIYAQDTPCQTMACMVESGAANLDSPTESEILERILMGNPASSAFSVQTEHAAILEWLQWSARCHSGVCGAIDNACDSGTGVPSTGRTPAGTCSEDELLEQYWDSVVVDRARCISCHGQENGETAPNWLAGLHQADWDNPEHRTIATTSMYAVITGNLIDKDEPLNSLLLTKPLQHGFRPFAVYGAQETIETVPEGVGTGVHHDGQSKMTFTCPGFDCSEGAIMDCRKTQDCDTDEFCGDGMRCNEGWCRLAESVCDETYVNYLSFIQTYLSCLE